MIDVGTLPRVSVVIPTHDRAELVRHAIDSVLAQTYAEIEVIVVDDGSSDGTARVVAGYGGRVTYLRQENLGVEEARKRGLRRSTGAYVNFLDDDDLMLPTKIAKQVELLEANPRYGAVHCRYHYVDGNDRLLETVGRQPEGDVLALLVWGCFPWSGGPLVRRECLERIGDEEHRDWHGDWGLWLRVALGGREFGAVQEPLGCYRMVRGSMTEEKVATCERLVFNVLGEVFTRWRLPADLVAQRDAVYAGWHFWLSCRYTMGGFWDEGARNLARVLELRPEWRVDPVPLLDLLHDDALTPRVRVADPLRLVSDFFDHLPVEAQFLGPHRERVLGRVQIGLALRSLAAEDLAAARAHIRAAVAVDPGLVERAESFRADLVGYARRVPSGEQTSFVDRVLQDLPPAARGLRRVRSRALADLAVATALDAYAAPDGQRAALDATLRAIVHRPGLLWRAPRHLLGRAANRVAERLGGSRVSGA